MNNLRHFSGVECVACGLILRYAGGKLNPTEQKFHEEGRCLPKGGIVGAASFPCAITVPLDLGAQGMNYDQLPADLRKQVDAQLGTKRRPRDRRQVTGEEGFDLRCHHCGLVTGPGQETARMRHTKESGHGRWDCIL